MTNTATDTAAYRASEKAIRTAQAIVDLVELSGVSMSPSTVRYELAKCLMQELSQNAIRRLHASVERAASPRRDRMDAIAAAATAALNTGGAYVSPIERPTKAAR